MATTCFLISQGKQKESPRTVFHYLDDEGLPVGVRIGDWKSSIR